MAGDKTWTVAEVVSAANVNSFFRDQVVTISATAPASKTLAEGAAWYDTTNHQLKFYAGATATWQQAWNQPWGHVTSATATADQTGLAANATTDVTSLTVTYTFVANRRIKIWGDILLATGTAGRQVYLAVAKDGGAIKRVCQLDGVPARSTTFSGFVLDTPTAGSHTYKLQVFQDNFGGAGTATVQNATVNGEIVIEDIGPSGSPS